jgi:predicted nucleic-acid-binding Zn-ribbon protein
MEPTDCPKCRGRMQEGFITDSTYGGLVVGAWIEGKPVKNFWTGLRISGRRKIQTSTWRCERCGYLESYAVAE